MFDYAPYIFWAYFLVVVPMVLVVLILIYKGREIRKKILDQKSDPSESVARGALSTYFLGAISLPALGFLEINSEEYKKSLIAELKRNCY